MSSPVMEIANGSVAQGLHMDNGMNCSIPATSPNGIRQAVLVVYSAGFIFGAAGNALVIGIIAYYKNIRIKSVANYYIWNLSLADLLFIFTLPFSIYASYTQDWPFGEVTCKISYAFRETNRFSSVFLLVALSWDRYVASFYNLNHLRTIKLGSVICIVIWVICATLSTPYWLYAQTKLSRNNQTMCVFHWPQKYRLEYMKLWTFLQLVIGLLLPLVMITLAYILLSARLKKMISGAAMSGVKKPSRKMTKTVAVVVTTFLVCQTPYYMMGVWSFLQQQKGHRHRLRGDCFLPSRLEVESLYYLNSIAEILVFVSSSINPILYGLMNDNYRELYRVVLCRCQRTPVARNGKALNVPVERTPTAGSGSESEGQEAAVAEVTYRFQGNKTKFNCPFAKKKTHNRGSTRQTQVTENILMEDVKNSPVTDL